MVYLDNKDDVFSLTMTLPTGAMSLAMNILVDAQRVLDLKPLAAIVLLRLVQNDRSTRCTGLQNRSRAIRVDVGNTQTLIFLLVKVQAGGILKVWDNAELLVLNLKISLGWAMDAEAILHILPYTSGWNLGGTLHVGGDNAELKLLEILFSVRDTTDKQLAVNMLGQVGLEIVAQELEGVVLLDVRLGDALIGDFYLKNTQTKTVPVEGQ